MRISRKWLSQYMDISAYSTEEIADKITAAGFEVEGIDRLSQGTNLVVGYVTECIDHPDSDHLHCCKVDVKDTVLSIVCGAPNVAAGQKVIVARDGAVLPGGVIKSGVIRGQASEGMICSLLELGVDPHSLSDEQKAGIEVLGDDAIVGDTDPLGYLGLDDEVLDVSLTPNRNDCQAAFSMALEVASVLNLDITLPAFDHASDKGTSTNLHVESKTASCPLFYGKKIGSIKIGPSPKWMKELLHASGMKSINNVVDISNLVMLETGQPMHFYDAKAIKNDEIIVNDGFNEEYVALDGISYHLLEDDIVITNDGKPIGIAGIMGGDDSKIEDTTTSLIIECAIFDHVKIRNTARRLNLATESSLRYQRGIEPLAAKKALDRAVQLLEEYADAKDIEETVKYGQEPFRARDVTCTLEDINHRLGTDFSAQEVLDVFVRLHLNPEFDGTTYTVHVPSTRMDIEGKADLSEEVIRLLGYDRLPSTLPLMEMTEGKRNPKQRAIVDTRNYFCGLGLQDSLTYTLISTFKKDNAILSAGTAIELASPMSEERRWIRTSILPSLLDVVAYNHARSIKDVNVFELSDVASQEKTLMHLAFVLSGSLQECRWTKDVLPADYYTAKGLLETWFDRLGINASRISYQTNDVDVAHFHPYRSAKILIGKQCVGLFGQIHPAYAKETDVDDVIMAEFDFDALVALKKAKIKYVSVSKYPSVTRDLAFVMDRNMEVDKVCTLIMQNGKVNKENVIRSVDVFDVYQGEHVKENEKSVALSMVFQSDTHTLTEEEINGLFNSLIDLIQTKLHATLRG